MACLKLASMRSPMLATTEACMLSNAAKSLSPFSWLLLRKKLKLAASRECAMSVTLLDNCFTACNLVTCCQHLVASVCQGSIVVHSPL